MKNFHKTEINLQFSCHNWAESSLYGNDHNNTKEKLLNQSFKTDLKPPKIEHRQVAIIMAIFGQIVQQIVTYQWNCAMFGALLALSCPIKCDYYYLLRTAGCHSRPFHYIYPEFTD
jgi:hypothetical protein